ncbi:MAG TPA: ribonuclease P protein component [Ignavibacteria bacterium]|nr:ribonuclease P protein component [Ignavibacteria bacterium]
MKISGETNSNNIKKNQPSQKNSGIINNRLSKQEILRGHLVYLSVIRDSVILKTDYLKVYVSRKNTESIKTDLNNISEINESPLLTKIVKVGFIITKKKIRKAVQRNRIRRLLKESYRLNKSKFYERSGMSIIFTLNDNGYSLFKNDPKIKCGFIETEMIKAAEKINKYFTKK